MTYSDAHHQGNQLMIRDTCATLFPRRTSLGLYPEEAHGYSP